MFDVGSFCRVYIYVYIHSYIREPALRLLEKKGGELVKIASLQTAAALESDKVPLSYLRKVIIK